MGAFLVEVYVSRANANAVQDADRRVHRAAEQLSLEGTRVRFLRSMFVLADEMCFYLYEAESAEAARQAAERAALLVERVTEARLDGG